MTIPHFRLFNLLDKLGLSTPLRLGANTIITDVRIDDEGHTVYTATASI